MNINVDSGANSGDEGLREQSAHDTQSLLHNQSAANIHHLDRRYDSIVSVQQLPGSMHSTVGS